jgi:hypothetical protein
MDVPFLEGAVWGLKIEADAITKALLGVCVAVKRFYVLKHAFGSEGFFDGGDELGVGAVGRLVEAQVLYDDGKKRERLIVQGLSDWHLEESLCIQLGISYGLRFQVGPCLILGVQEARYPQKLSLVVNSYAFQPQASFGLVETFQAIRDS